MNVINECYSNVSGRCGCVGPMTAGMVKSSPQASFICTISKTTILLAGRHWIGKNGGAILRPQKKDFGAIPYILVIADYKKAILYIASKQFLSDMDEQAQQIKTESVLAKQKVLFCQNTSVFWP